MQEYDRMEFAGDTYNLSSERWRNPTYTEFVPGFLHGHHLDLEDPIKRPRLFYSPYNREYCVFCQADLTFDRTIGEILYHFTKCNDYPMVKIHRMLIDKWKDNVDAWDNPIGNNIKGE